MRHLILPRHECILSLQPIHHAHRRDTRTFTPFALINHPLLTVHSFSGSTSSKQYLVTSVATTLYISTFAICLPAHMRLPAPNDKSASFIAPSRALKSSSLSPSPSSQRSGRNAPGASPNGAVRLTMNGFIPTAVPPGTKLPSGSERPLVGT